MTVITKSPFRAVFGTKSPYRRVYETTITDRHPQISDHYSHEIQLLGSAVFDKENDYRVEVGGGLY